MIARRDLLIGGACVAAAAAAYGLTPRQRISLLGSAKLEQIVPRQFGTWTSRDVSDLVAPETPDSLMARLYSETVGRVYNQVSTGAAVMMLLAHGDTQSNDLQLHRPEVCYPAFGFAISRSTPIGLSLAGGVAVPARRLVAVAPGRQENIVYWSRLGEYLPTDGAQQRIDRLKTAMAGRIYDGLLARFSVLGSDTDAAFAMVQNFIGELVLAVRGPQRVGLIGTSRASAMLAARV
jgi:EpsI family protein